VSNLIVILIAAWLALNFLLVPATGLLLTQRRRAHEPSGLLDPPGSSADAYVSILLSRLMAQACRVLGVEQTTLLVRDGADERGFIAVAAHGMPENVIGRRVPIEDALASPVGRAVARDLRRILPEAAADAGVAISAATPSGRVVVLCAVDRVAQLDQGELRLLRELASLCAAAVEDMGPHGRPERAVRTCATALAAVGESRNSAPRRSAVDLTALATRIGNRLGLDRGALIELQLAGCVYDMAIAATPSTAALPAGVDPREPALRAVPTAEQLGRVPGFEAVALVVGLIGERWDGRGGPHGLRGDRIPLASRILAACGAMDALTTNPPRGRGAPIDTAIRQIQATSGTLFDPTVVAALSQELMGDVALADEIAPVADWAGADVLYSIT